MIKAVRTYLFTVLLGNWRHKVFVPWTITTKEDKGPLLPPSISEYFGFYDWLIDYLFDFCLLRKSILAVKSGQNLWLQQQSLLLRDKTMKIKLELCIAHSWDTGSKDDGANYVRRVSVFVFSFSFAISLKGT